MHTIPEYNMKTGYNDQSAVSMGLWQGILSSRRKPEALKSLVTAGAGQMHTPPALPAACNLGARRPPTNGGAATPATGVHAARPLWPGPLARAPATQESEGSNKQASGADVAAGASSRTSPAAPFCNPADRKRRRRGRRAAGCVGANKTFVVGEGDAPRARKGKWQRGQCCRGRGRAGRVGRGGASTPRGRNAVGCPNRTMPGARCAGDLRALLLCGPGGCDRRSKGQRLHRERTTG